MRKYLIVAIAALTAVAFATVAIAQAPEATMDVTVTPKKAGKKKKAKNSQIRLEIENQDTSRTMSELTITSPKTVKLSTRGLTQCDATTLENEGPSGCPRASRVGKGTASALLGVNTANPSPLTFDVVAVVTGRRNIGFHLAAREIPTVVLAPGTLSGRKLTIEVPDAAQQPVPGTYAGLVSLEATLKAKEGKRTLVSTTDCKRKKHAYSTVLTFVDNGVSPAGTVTAKATSACR
ncbi:MAG: hypothetical protein ACRDPC_23095 [Solirubrobacteraceae bacterium]